MRRLISLDRPTTLPGVIERQNRLMVAGAILCVGFILAIAIVFTVGQESNAHARKRDRQHVAEAAGSQHHLALVIAHNLALSNAYAIRTGDYIGCVKRNNLRDSTAAYIKVFISNARRTYMATLNSPTTSNEQKRAVQMNTISLDAAEQSSRVAFAHENCGKVPVAPVLTALP